MKLHLPSELAENSLDIAVVIPCYNEGADIFAHLECYLEQKGLLRNVQIGVFVVVNNARDAAQSVLDANETTCNIVRTLIKCEKYAYDPKSILGKFQKLFHGRIKLILVDISGREESFEECNVGIASSVGCYTALPYLKNGKSFFVRTDADTRFSPHYLATVANLINNPLIDAATGPITFYNYEDDPPSWDPARRLMELENNRQKTIQGCVELFRLSRPRGVDQACMTGSNMVFRKEVFQKAGGFPPDKAAEDRGFSFELLKRGRYIAYSEDLTVSTHARVSDRTDDNHSLGGRVKKTLKEESWEEKLVDSFSAETAFREIIHLIFSLNEQGVSEEEWLKTVKEQLECSEQEAREILEIKREFPGTIYPSFYKKLNDKLKDLIRKNHPQITLKDAQEELKRIILENAPQRDPFLGKTLEKVMAVFDTCKGLERKKRSQMMAHFKGREFPQETSYSLLLGKNETEGKNIQIMEEETMLALLYQGFFHMEHFLLILDYFENDPDNSERRRTVVENLITSLSNRMILDIIMYWHSKQKDLHQILTTDGIDIPEFHELDKLYRELKPGTVMDRDAFYQVIMESIKTVQALDENVDHSKLIEMLQDMEFTCVLLNYQLTEKYPERSI